MARSAKLEELLVRVEKSRLPPPAVRRRLRRSCGISLRDAAAALSVATMTYYRWETGAAEPKPHHAVAYREFLDALEQITT